jgi:peptidoglycan/xylan/chitin deacetylase (PgdA/CDA1 family)
VPYVGSIVFPGANAFVDTWYDVIGTGDRTVRATFLAKGGGENSAGRIFDNGKFIVYVDANRAIKVSSDGLTTTGTTPNGVVKWNRWHDLVIERAANGTADIYLDGILVASGQNTGTPAVGNHSYAVTLESFENVSDWTPGGVGGSVTEDTTYFKDGTKSFKIVAPAGDGYFATRVISQNFSNTDTFAFWVYIPTQTDLDNLFSLGIYLTAQSNFSTYFLANPSAQYHLGWNKILLHKNDFTASGGASWSSTMIRLRVRANAGAGGPATVYVDKLEGDTRTKPKVLITFDDGWETQYTNAFLYMNTLGLRGTNYVIGSKANQSMYLTTEQIREMYDADWDIATHGFTNLTTMSLAEAETDVNTERQWIIDNGFTRREAYNHYAYPNGGYNQDLMDMLEDNNFVSGRTIVEKTQPEEIDEPFALTRRSIINTTSIAAAKAYIDKLILTGGALLLNFHRIVETPVYDTEWSIDNFEELMDYIKSKVDTASVENIVISELVPGLPDSLLIGDNFASNRCFNGYIAGARVYENDLSTEEVEQLYLTNATLYDNNPSVCVLNLETLAGRISGTTWTDVSGNEKHGTLSGATLVEGVAPSKVRTSV